MNLTEIKSHLKQETKYSKLYFSIIFKAKFENRKKLKQTESGYIYFEGHHILPDSMFKEYADFKINPWNKVLLTAKEHFICHLLIWKHYKSLKYTYGERKMSRGILALNNMGEYNSVMYEHYKLNMTVSDETRKRLSIANTGKSNGPLSEDHKQKISKSSKGRITSPQHKENISKTKKGMVFSKKHKSNLSTAAMKRTPMSEETKLKISKSQKGSKSSCSKVINIYNKDGELMFVCDGGFKDFCSINNLPKDALIKSYRNNTTLYETTRSKTRATNNGNAKFIGWYAKEK